MGCNWDGNPLLRAPLCGANKVLEHGHAPVLLWNIVWNPFKTQLTFLFWVIISPPKGGKEGVIDCVASSPVRLTTSCHNAQNCNVLKVRFSDSVYRLYSASPHWTVNLLHVWTFLVDNSLFRTKLSKMQFKIVLTAVLVYCLIAHCSLLRCPQRV